DEPSETGLRIEPLAIAGGDAAPRWHAEPVREIELPGDIVASFATATDLWLGTTGRGVLRWAGTGHVLTYQSRDFAGADGRLSVACTAPEACYVANGLHAWRFDGSGFVDAEVDREPGARILALARDPRGEVIAIHRGARGRALRLSRVASGVWTPIAVQEIE